MSRFYAPPISRSTEDVDFDTTPLDCLSSAPEWDVGDISTILDATTASSSPCPSGWMSAKIGEVSSTVLQPQTVTSAVAASHGSAVDRMPGFPLLPPDFLRQLRSNLNPTPLSVPSQSAAIGLDLCDKLEIGRSITASSTASLSENSTSGAISDQSVSSSRSAWELLANPTTPQQQPLRALSAYNFFFRDERERILQGETVRDLTATRQSRLLREHWSKDRSKKRQHRKSHGKIDFASLSKLISQRWKSLPASDKSFYKDLAARDLERYQRDLDAVKDVDLPNFRAYLNAVA